MRKILVLLIGLVLIGGVVYAQPYKTMRYEGDTYAEGEDSGGDGYFFVVEDGTEYLRVTGGYVGIGTTTPSSELDVSGTITTQDIDITSSGLLDVTPTGAANIKSLVNKEYVDLAVTSLGATYYMYDEDDATGYKTCYLNPSSDSEEYIEDADLSNDDYIGGWISASGEAPTKLLKGVYNWYITVEKTTGTKDLRVYWKLIERKTDTSETIVATSSDPLQLSNDYLPDSGSRIVGKLYVDVSGTGSDPTIRVYYQGTTSSRWEIPANTEIFQNIFIPYEGAEKDVDLGSKALVTTGNVAVGTDTPVSKLTVNGTLGLQSAADPDVTNAGELTFDSDGANESGDSYYRGTDGTNQYPVGQKIVTMNFPLIEPGSINAADLIPVWHNTTGMTFTIVEWKAWSDDDNVSLELEELTDPADFTAITTVDAVEIATDGTSVYYASDTAITHGVIEHDHTLAIDFDTNDTPDYVLLTVKGWFNADVD